VLLARRSVEPHLEEDGTQPGVLGCSTGRREHSECAPEDVINTILAYDQHLNTNTAGILDARICQLFSGAQYEAYSSLAVLRQDPVQQIHVCGPAAAAA